MRWFWGKKYKYQCQKSAWILGFALLVFVNIICYLLVHQLFDGSYVTRTESFDWKSLLLLGVGLTLFLCNCCRRRELRLDFVSVNILFWLRNALPMPNNFWKARKSRLKCKNKNKSSRKGCWISYLQHFGFKLEFIGKIDLPLCTGSDIGRRKKTLVSQKQVWDVFFYRKTVELWAIESKVTALKIASQKVSTC